MSPTAPVVVSQSLRRRRGLTEQAAIAAVDQACPPSEQSWMRPWPWLGRNSSPTKDSSPRSCWQSVMTGTAAPPSGE